MPTEQPTSTTKLFIKGVDKSVDEKALELAFSKYGRILEVSLGRDKETKVSKGFGFITFECAEDVQDAVKGMHGKELSGSILHVDIATERQASFNPGFRGRGGRGHDNGRFPGRGGGRQFGERGGFGGFRGADGPDNFDRFGAPGYRQPENPGFVPESSRGFGLPRDPYRGPAEGYRAGSPRGFDRFGPEAGRGYGYPEPRRPSPERFRNDAGYGPERPRDLNYGRETWEQGGPERGYGLSDTRGPVRDFGPSDPDVMGRGYGPLDSREPDRGYRPLDQRRPDRGYGPGDESFRVREREFGPDSQGRPYVDARRPEMPDSRRLEGRYGMPDSREMDRGFGLDARGAGGFGSDNLRGPERLSDSRGLGYGPSDSRDMGRDYPPPIRGEPGREFEQERGYSRRPEERGPGYARSPDRGYVVPDRRDLDLGYGRPDAQGLDRGSYRAPDVRGPADVRGPPGLDRGYSSSDVVSPYRGYDNREPDRMGAVDRGYSYGDSGEPRARSYLSPNRMEPDDRRGFPARDFPVGGEPNRDPFKYPDRGNGYSTERPFDDKMRFEGGPPNVPYRSDDYPRLPGRDDRGMGMRMPSRDDFEGPPPKRMAGPSYAQGPPSGGGMYQAPGQGRPLFR